MILPARNIWDTRIQSVCAVISARDGQDAEVWMCGNFGQASLDPPRVVINPNRLYPIEGIIRREGRFAINVLSASHRDAAWRLMNARRRSPGKTKLLGLPVLDDNPFGIPYLGDCLRTVFCEVEQILDSGDHTVMIASVLEVRANPSRAGDRPLLFPEARGKPPRIVRLVEAFLAWTGVKQAIRKALARRRGEAKVDLPGNTYREGGRTDAEIEQSLRYGIFDPGPAISPPQKAPAAIGRKISVCVAGIGAWGSYHCRLIREASPQVELYLCGQNPERLRRLVRTMGAAGGITGVEKAVADPRVEALSLVLPHHLHSWAAQMAAAAGKHVLVEKPLATSLEDADAMIRAARSAGTILMVAENFHFWPAVREAAAAIARGELGEPLYMEVNAGGILHPEGWKAAKDLMGGGVLMDLGVHYIRAMRLMLGEPHRVLASRAMQINTRISGEDSVQVLFASEYGWQAHMLLSWASPRGHHPSIIVAGEKGTIHLWPGVRYYDFYSATPRLPARLASDLHIYRLAETLMSPERQRVRRRIADPDCAGYVSEIREFLAAVVEKRQPASGPEDARRDLEIVLRAYDALREAAWVRIGGSGGVADWPIP
jgi:predicted dehydrogenase/flavin reductase (DIM6/NTAB) family NADH-FMN oxidoreductase RutF